MKNFGSNSLNKFRLNMVLVLEFKPSFCFGFGQLKLKLAINYHLTLSSVPIFPPKNKIKENFKFDFRT
jgi:hypothetical protein